MYPGTRNARGALVTREDRVQTLGAESVIVVEDPDGTRSGHLLDSKNEKSMCEDENISSRDCCGQQQDGVRPHDGWNTVAARVDERDHAYGMQCAKSRQGNGTSSSIGSKEDNLKTKESNKRHQWLVEDPIGMLEETAQREAELLKAQFDGLYKEYNGDHIKGALRADFDSMRNEDECMNANHWTFETYHAGGRKAGVDGRVQDATDKDDTLLQAAIAYDAAGCDPSVPPSVVGNVDERTNGMSWLERMRRQDEALQAAIARDDVA